MAALDFPNAPTNGTQYSAPNGALYTFDGTAWTVSGVISTGTAAGGVLSGTYPNPGFAPGATLNASGQMANQTLVTAGNNTLTWIGEISATVATNRYAFLFLRVYLEIYRLGSGISGQVFNVMTYVGGTSGNSDGTQLTTEEVASIALGNTNETVSLWYPLTYIATPTTTTLLWKAFMLNPNNTVFGMHKRGIGMQIQQPA